MNITSNEIMIFSKEYNGKMYYRAGLSSKNKDGKYENAYMDIKLPKGVELENKSKIRITKGFLSFYKNKENKDVWYIVVQEYTTSGEIYKVESVKTEDIDTDIDLPF